MCHFSGHSIYNYSHHEPRTCGPAPIRLIRTSDPYTTLEPGDLGTAEFEDDTGTLFVRWDSGSGLGLVPNEDRWELVD